MDRKILLIGQDRIKENRLSEILVNCDLPGFEVIQNSSIEYSWKTIADSDFCLFLINIKNLTKVRKFLLFQRRKNFFTPIILVNSAGRKDLEVLISLGACDVIHPENLNEINLTQAVLSAIEQKRVESELRSRDNIMQAINYAAEVFLTHLDWDSRIDEVLAHFGSATKADKICIYKNHMNMEVGIASDMHAGWKSSDEYQFDDAHSVSESDPRGFASSRWKDLLKSGEVVYGSVLDFPSEEQPSLSKRQIQSLAVIPIFSDQIWWGFITFEHCRTEKRWTHIELDVLKTAAKILGAGISRLDAETRLTHLATHDYLTNLPNRMLLEDRFEQALARADRSKKKFGIIAIDLDKFKQVNDAHGHPFGDKVLIEIAWRLSETVRTSDTCARVGGDEFTVLAEGINNKKDLMRVMEKLIHAISPPINIESKEVLVTASMGASIYPNHGSQMEHLMKAADIVLYQVKDAYSGCRIYSDEQITFIKD